MRTGGVTVAICSRNRPRMLLEAVNDILSGTSLPDELLIVDQSATANRRVQSLASQRGDVSYIQSSTIGLSRSRNIALSAARHPVIAFVDDDVRVAPDWLESIIARLLRAGDDYIVTGRVLAGKPEASGAFASSTVPTEEAEVTYGGKLTMDVLRTFNMAVYRDVAVSVGGFDEELGPGTKYPAGEDNEFAYRALLSGRKILYYPAARVYHRAWRPRSSFESLRFAYGRGQGAFFGKYWHDAHIQLRFARTFGGRMIRLPLRAAHGRESLRADVAWLSGFVSGYLEHRLDQLLKRLPRFH